MRAELECKAGDISSLQDYVNSKKRAFKHDGRASCVVERPSDGLFIYPSGNAVDWDLSLDVAAARHNLNGKFRDSTGEKIVCRHLAYAWLSVDKCRKKTIKPGQYYSQLFRSSEGIRTIDGLRTNAFDRLDIDRKGRSYNSGGIEGGGFGLALKSACKKLAVNGRVTLTLSSFNHLMAISVYRKEKS